MTEMTDEQIIEMYRNGASLRKIAVLGSKRTFGCRASNTGETR